MNRSPRKESGTRLPLDYIGMGKIRNAPFAADFSRVFYFDRLFRATTFFAHFPPAPESFFPNPVVYTPVDAFLPDSFLPDAFYSVWAIVLAEYFLQGRGLNLPPRRKSGALSPLSYLVMSGCTNAPFATHSPCFLTSIRALARPLFCSVFR